MKEKRPEVITVGIVFSDQIMSGFTRLPEWGKEVFGVHSGPFIGGGSAITAVRLEKLGVHCKCVARVGNDAFGGWFHEQLKEYGVDTESLYCDAAARTNITVAITSKTDRSYVSYLGMAEESELKILDEICVNELSHNVNTYRHVHLCGHKHDIGCIRQMKKYGVTLSLDIGWDETERWDGIIELLKWVDVFMPNEFEALRITGSTGIDEALRILQSYTKAVVIKRGASGSIGLKGSQYASAPAFIVDAIDATGAGESFNAGYLYGMLSGFSLSQSLTIGNACGALAVMQPGGLSKLLGINDVYNFIKGEKHETNL